MNYRMHIVNENVLLSYLSKIFQWDPVISLQLKVTNDKEDEFYSLGRSTSENNLIVALLLGWVIIFAVYMKSINVQFL